MADPEDFESLLAQYEQGHAESTNRDPQVGDKVRGTVVSVSASHVFVDLGAKSEGSIDTEELAGSDGELTVKVGDSIEATVLRSDEQTGTLVLGCKARRRVHGSEELEQAFQNQLPVEGLVSKVTKGGVEVQIAGVRAFCPASQLDINYIEDMSVFVGQHLAFRITRYEGGRHLNLVVSRRELLEEEQRALAEATRARLEVGAVLSGVVKSLQDYGAFVDLGGVEGMVHISELSHVRVDHPKDILSVGQQVEVEVLRIEKTDNPRHPEKIALSIRAREKDPWQDADQQFPVGARVSGTVTRLQPFGAFVELAPGIEGLIHISELGAGRRINHPHEVLNPGQEVEPTVLTVDVEKRRIGLSLGASHQSDEAAAEAEAYRAYKEPEQSMGTLGDLLRESMEKQKQR